MNNDGNLKLYFLFLMLVKLKVISAQINIEETNFLFQIVADDTVEPLSFFMSSKYLKHLLHTLKHEISFETWCPISTRKSLVWSILRVF